MPELDAEPGKILHELRRGKAATTWFPVYYGSVDSTPLFLVLLSEMWRWTETTPSSGAKSPRARARSGGSSETATVTATVSSSTSGARRGLENQSWKDSGDSQRFRGRAARGAADRARRGAGLRVRRPAPERPSWPGQVWGDAELAARLEAEADGAPRTVRRGVLDRGARGLRARARRLKQQVDSLCSNIGHLLWSGIVPTPPRRCRRGALRATSSGRAGACARWAPRRRRTTRSATTTARSGRTTPPSRRGASRATDPGRASRGSPAA